MAETAVMQPRATSASCGRTDCSVRSEPKFLKRCGHCKKVAYCSRECQVADWRPNHKAYCDMMRDEPNIVKVNSKSIGSQNTAIAEAEDAFFGDRPVTDRIQFCRIDGQERDSRDAFAYVRSLDMLLIISYARKKFLEFGWKHAVIYSIDHPSGQSQNGPGQFASMPYGLAQKTRIHQLQESISGYDPAQECVLMMYRLAKDKASVKVWIISPQIPAESAQAKELKDCEEGMRAIAEPHYNNIQRDDIIEL